MSDKAKAQTVSSKGSPTRGNQETRASNTSLGSKSSQKTGNSQGPENESSKKKLCNPCVII